MLLRIGIGVGVVDQQSTSGAALPPVLTWTSPSSDNTPDFTVDISLTSAVAGNVVTLQIDTNSSFPAPTTYTHTLTAPEILAGSFSMATGPFASNTYFARCRITGTGWSNTVTVTIAANPVVTFIGSVSAAVSGSSSTALSASIGTASSDRLVVVCVGYQSGSKSVSSATIQGIAATVVITQAVNGASCAIISANVPTGTTGDIVINYSGANTGANDTLSIFTITNLSSFTAVGTAISGVTGSTTMTASPNTSANGVIITVSETQFSDITSTISVSTSTETFTTGAKTYNVGDGRTHFSAYASNVAANTPSVVTVSWSTNQTGSIASASWR